jgi:DNA-directed RNA polymerase specialized sigma54-like protein
MLKPSLQLRIGQQLTMTPQLQQAIRLLQLPSLDLQAHVRETLETNVMLEAEDELPRAHAETAREREERPPRRKYAELDGNTHARRSARRARGGDRRRGLGRADQRPVRFPLVGRRRPQQRFQRPARPDLQEQLIEQLELAKLSPSTWPSPASSPTPSPTTAT